MQTDSSRMHSGPLDSGQCGIVSMRQALILSTSAKITWKLIIVFWTLQVDK